jgi:hypothetical protein
MNDTFGLFLSNGSKDREMCFIPHSVGMSTERNLETHQKHENQVQWHNFILLLLLLHYTQILYEIKETMSD